MMLTLPSKFSRNQELIDLMSDNSVHLSGSETLDEMIAAYSNTQIEPIRDKILRMEDYLLAQPQIEIQVRHYINNGIYYREITIPKGAFCTGAIYRESHIHFVLRGDMTVLTESGLKRVTGPCTFVSDSGMKRAGYAYEETVWSAVFRTEETDPEKAFEAIEKMAR